MEEEKDISQAKKEYSWGSEIIVNLDEMRCSWSNAPQPITSTAADTGGHVDRVLYMTAILMHLYVGSEWNVAFIQASLFAVLQICHVPQGQEQGPIQVPVESLKEMDKRRVLDGIFH